MTRPPAPAAAAIALSPALVGKAEPLPATDPAAAAADRASATQPAGEGGISDGVALKITADAPVHRLWSGPDGQDQNGNTHLRVGW